MRKLLLCLAACALFMNAAQAINDPVPDYKLLTELPATARILVNRSINVSQISPTARYVKQQFGKATVVMVPSADHRPRILETGQTIEIEKVTRNPGHTEIRLATDKLIYLFSPDIYLDSTATVSDFNQIFKGAMSIVFDGQPFVDPYPGMPNDVKQDFLMAKILTAIKAGRYADSLPSFEQIEKSGSAQPESFYYYYIVALDKSDRGTTAKRRGAEFLKTYGKKSKFYNEVLGIVAK